MIALLKQLHKDPLTEDIFEKELELVTFDDNIMQRDNRNLETSIQSNTNSKTALVNSLISKLEPIITAYFRLP